MKNSFSYLYLPLLIFFLFTQGIFSQEKSIKLYTNSLYIYSSQNPKQYNFQGKLYHFNGITFAYQYKNKKDLLHEIEASLLYDIDHTVTEDAKQIGLNLRYELGRYIFKNKFKKVRFQIAGASEFYFLNEHIEPIIHDIFPRYIKRTGFELSVFTHFEYDLTKKLYLDINANIIGFNFLLNTHYHDSPRLPLEQRNNYSFELSFLQERLLRIGLGYRFGSIKK